MVEFVFSFWNQMGLWEGFITFLAFLILFFGAILYLSRSGGKESDIEKIRQRAGLEREQVRYSLELKEED